MKDIDNYFFQKQDPVKSCLAALRQIILQSHSNVIEVWRYRMPFYCYKSGSGQEIRFAYLWVDKKSSFPYLGIVEGKHFNHPDLIAEKRSRMKIMLIDPNEDLPIEIINSILNQAIVLCQNNTE